MSNAEAGGNAMDAMVKVEENTGQVPAFGIEGVADEEVDAFLAAVNERPPTMDARAWMVMGSLASALEDLLDERPLRDLDERHPGNFGYARTALSAYHDLKTDTATT